MTRTMQEKATWRTVQRTTILLGALELTYMVRTLCAPFIYICIYVCLTLYIHPFDGSHVGIQSSTTHPSTML